MKSLNQFRSDSTVGPVQIRFNGWPSSDQMKLLNEFTSDETAAPMHVK
jgi:hypothetical protein